MSGWYRGMNAYEICLLDYRIQVGVGTAIHVICEVATSQLFSLLRPPWKNLRLQRFSLSHYLRMRVAPAWCCTGASAYEWLLSSLEVYMRICCDCTEFGFRLSSRQEQLFIDRNCWGIYRIGAQSFAFAFLLDRNKCLLTGTCGACIGSEAFPTDHCWERTRRAIWICQMCSFSWGTTVEYSRGVLGFLLRMQSFALAFLVDRNNYRFRLSSR